MSSIYFPEGLVNYYILNTNQIKCQEKRATAKLVKNSNLSRVGTYIWSICSKNCVFVFCPSSLTIKHK